MPAPDYDRDVTILQSSLRKDGILAAVDEFELVKPLGVGGFGTVYLARDTTSDIEVALKVVGKDRKTAFCSFGWDETRAPEGPRKLEDELRGNFKLIHGLTHPNIAVAYPLHLVKDVRQVAGRVSIARGDVLSVMAYAPGVTLDKWRMMFEGGRVPARLVSDIVKQVASALDYAHANGVIHRDVKPSNIMVDTRMGCKPSVRLLDFGLAAAAEGGQGVCGTPQYMSPEQWGGKRQGERTDQYSLAVLACELLTGHVPLEAVFGCGDRDVMRIAVTNREVEFPRGLSSGQRQAIEKAMAKSAEDRFATCEEFAVALSRRANPVVRGVKWFLLAAVVLSAGVVLMMRLKEPTKEAEVEPAKEEKVELAKEALPDTVARAPTNHPSARAPTGRSGEPSARAPTKEAEAEPQPEPKPVAKQPEPVVVPVSSPVPSPTPKAEPQPEPKPVAKQPEPPPAPKPKPTLDEAVQAKLRRADQDFADLKARYRDADGYKDVEQVRQRIADAKSKGAFDEIEPLCREYVGLLGEKERAMSEQVRKLLGRAKEALNELELGEFVGACKGVLAVDPNNREVADLRANCKDSLLQGAIASAQNARASKGAKRAEHWKKCKLAAEAVLRIDPTNREARRLLPQAENGLETADSPTVATPQNTLWGTRSSNGLEWLNTREANE